MLLHVQYVVVARDDDDGGVLTTLLWLNNDTHHKKTMHIKQPVRFNSLSICWWLSKSSLTN